jgi:tetrapyrrole methylase family protein/MazG family protein
MKRNPWYFPEPIKRRKKKMTKNQNRTLRKSRESLRRKEKSSFLKGIPEDLPALRRATLLTQRASRVGFDWPDLKGVLRKMDEEIKEFKVALSRKDRGRIEDELGDFLFVVANVGRFLRIDPEQALRRTLRKFIARFHYIETSLYQRGRSLHESNLMEMDRLWNEAKKRRKPR